MNLRLVNIFNLYFLLILSLFWFTLDNINAQEIDRVAKSICESHQIDQNSKELSLSEVNIITSEIQKNLISLLDTNRKDVKNQINVVTYKLFRELNKGCLQGKLGNSTLLPLSSIVDIENLFTQQQVDSISVKVKNFRLKNKIELLFVSLDDLYPYSNLKEFAIHQSNKWEIGRLTKEGGVTIVFSSKMRLVQIVTNEKIRNRLTNEESSEIIRDILIPEFKNEDYYQAVINGIDGIQNKIDN
ncbi:MAG: TPM domain-containing protein [Bacteroidales bacterium]|nr:TPM domain-containing protein [Bacteroidales bacterium]